MLSFWIISGLLIIVALVIVLPSLFANEAPKDLDRNKINKAVYDKKLLELENDLNNDLIEQEQYLIAKADLERSLLDDIEGNENLAYKSANKILPIIVLIVLPIAAVLTYTQLDNGLESLDPEFQRKMAEQRANPGMGQITSIEQAITELEEKIKQNPDNLENLIMLGRSYVVTKRFKEAVNIYAKANELSNGANPNILVSLGEAKGFAADNKFDESSMTLFSKALQIDPKNERGLWYAGLAAYQLQDYKLSVKHFEKLMQQVPEDQMEVKNALAKYLNDAKQKAGIEVTQVEKISEKGSASITVNVSLANNLAEKIVNSDTLFIYARAMNGPKMPLALVKMTAGDLPATVTLDDSVSMLPSMTLSSMEQVEVIARISKSGQAIMQTGDIFGSIQPVETNQSKTVDVEISELAP
ncbi:MAG: c-type cytochrome biogenesis protein CcmI [Pseudomonadota bacterium]